MVDFPLQEIQATFFHKVQLKSFVTEIIAYVESFSESEDVSKMIGKRNCTRYNAKLYSDSVVFCSCS